MLPEEVTHAFESLKRTALVEITKDLEPAESGSARFWCKVPVPQPNAEGLPASVELEAQIPPGFPFDKITFVSRDPHLDGFPHQSVSKDAGGELCLRSQSEYPWDASERLEAYVRSAIDWVEDAAHQRLLVAGQPWELPDFRREDRRGPVVLFSESSDTLAAWTAQTGKVGAAELAPHANGKDLVVVKFSREKDTIFAPSFSPAFFDTSTRTPCRWLLLPSIVYKRHRRPRSFGELSEMCERVGIDLWAVLRAATKKGSLGGTHYVLVGAPIPKVVGGDPVEVHWQPIAISEKAADAAAKATIRTGGDGKDVARARFRYALRESEIPWAQAENVGGTRMSVRGVLHQDARTRRACVLGCGALGSLVIEHLVRGGVRHVAVFDNDRVELQNLTRHTLTARDLGEHKALAVARRLNGIFPDTSVLPFPFRVPFGDGSKLLTLAKEAVDAADVLIDCTTNQSAFRWASRLGRDQSKLVLHLFVNAHARMLTICASGRHASCARVADQLFADVAAANCPFEREEYDPADPQIEPGAGCWDATFPARDHDMASLVAAGVPIVERLLSGKRASKGLAVVLRRRELPTEVLPQPLVEIALSRNYR